MEGHLYRTREVVETLWRWDMACRLINDSRFPYEGVRRTPISKEDAECARLIEDILRPINKRRDYE